MQVNNNLEFLRVVNETLEDYGKTAKDVLWVGTADGKFSVPWDVFEQSVRQSTLRWYCPGTASSDIPEGFVVVGDCWWIRRNESGGFEEWEFLQKPEPSALNNQRLVLGERERMDAGK